MIQSKNSLKINFLPNSCSAQQSIQFSHSFAFKSRKSLPKNIENMSKSHKQRKKNPIKHSNEEQLSQTLSKTKHK